ncbi:MAG: NAD(P)-binding domain-containing protein [Flavobacteriales bacterium]|nr:NAD(P)-binding domain-containing protein [Flavobacteriales bacterium]MBP6697624.1 NAD(P)-binding domain-containing protein [Flavobacteriales bacterium]
MGKKIGILGTGMVGQVLASGFLKHGHSVMIATRNPDKVADWVDKNPGGKVGSHKDVGAWADIIVLSSKGSAAVAAIGLCDSVDLAGKTVIDTTNPIADAPPTNGVLHYFTTLEESLMEQLQKACPKAHFVKAFNSVGNAYMVNPDFNGVKPTMFICGNDADAKQEVAVILDQFGWEAEDMGGMEGARAIEPLCILWCIPGFARNQWNHAFKLLKK